MEDKKSVSVGEIAQYIALASTFGFFVSYFYEYFFLSTLGIRINELPISLQDILLNSLGWMFMGFIGLGVGMIFQLAIYYEEKHKADIPGYKDGSKKLELLIVKLVVFGAGMSILMYLTHGDKRIFALAIPISIVIIIVGNKVFLKYFPYYFRVILLTIITILIFVILSAKFSAYQTFVFDKWNLREIVIDNQMAQAKILQTYDKGRLLQTSADEVVFVDNENNKTVFKLDKSNYWEGYGATIVGYFK